MLLTLILTMGRMLLTLIPAAKRMLPMLIPRSEGDENQGVKDWNFSDVNGKESEDQLPCHENMKTLVGTNFTEKKKKISELVLNKSLRAICWCKIRKYMKSSLNQIRLCKTRNQISLSLLHLKRGHLLLYLVYLPELPERRCWKQVIN
jgi:hypothetical protein